MVTQLKRLLIGMVGLILGVSSCSLGAPPPPTSDHSAALTLTSLVETVATQAVTVPGDASATFPPDGFPTATELPPTAATTAAPILLTPTFTVIPSPSVPVVSVTTGTNCRSGPGQVYDLIGGAPVGVKFVLIGKNTQTDYWIIRLEDGRECWLWGRYAVVEGDPSALPEYVIPALPVGSVSGLVTDNFGAPVLNAKVTALLSQKTFTTDSNGRYSIEDLRTGTEFISVAAVSYFPERRSVTISQGGVVAADFVLISGIPGPPVPSPVTVEGLVLTNGAPAVGARVWVWNSNKEAFTDNNGRYRVNLPEGNFLILAELDGRRGGTEVTIPRNQTSMTAPDILLLQR